MTLHPRSESPNPLRRALGGFAAAWGRWAAGRGAAPGEEGGSALGYLEPFAGADHPRGVPLAASVVEALREIGARRPAGWAAAMLLEEDPVKAEWLRAHLAEGAGGVRVAVEETAPERAAEVVPAGEATALLSVVDAPGARRLSLEWLRALLREPGAAVLLRVPVEDLRRLAHFHGTPLASLPPYGRRLVEGWSALLGDPRHGWLLPWSAGQDDAGAAERAVVEALAARLGEAPGVRVAVECVLPAGAEHPEHLLVAGPDAELPYLLTESVHLAREEGHLRWPDEPPALLRYERLGELELFGGAGGAERRTRVVDVVGVANRVAGAFTGRTTTLREVLGALEGEALFRDDVRRALLELRRDGRALFRSLAAPDARLAFPRAGAARPTPRGARRRGDTGEELSLSLEETGELEA